MTTAEQATYYAAHARWQHRQMVANRRVVLAQFGAWLQTLLAYLDHHTPTQTADDLPVLVSNDTHRDLLSALYQQTGLAAATREYERLLPPRKDINPLDLARVALAAPVSSAPIGAGFYSLQWRTAIAMILSRSESVRRITQLSDQTRILIRDLLTRGAQQNWSIAELSRNLTGLLGPRSKVARRRATLIARTETTRAASIGTEQGATSTKLKLEKKWLATPDARTRDPHRAMLRAKPVGQYAHFTVGGRPMLYPGDPAGGARNCCNCRCSIVYVPVAD